MDVNIWSTFKKGGRVSEYETSTLLPSQRLKQQTFLQKAVPEPVVELDLFETISIINSLPKEDVREILEVFETEVFTDENYDDILKRVVMLSNYGIIPELVEDETVGGVKYVMRETQPKSSQLIRRPSGRLPTLPPVPRQEVNTYPKISDERKEEILSLIQSTIFERNSMSKIVKLIFEDLPLQIFTKEQKQPYRDIYEHGDITSQCNNTIGKVDSVDMSSVRKFPTCYICGIPFYEDVKEGMFTGLYQEVEDQLRSTCEHVLPAIQAAFFLHMYNPKLNMEDPVIKHELQLEYSWAHRCCNYEKSDISFLGLRFERGNPVSFVFNSHNTRDVLKGIASPSNQRAGLHVVQNQIPSRDEWIDGRLSILESKMNRIVDYLNSRGNLAFLFAIGYDKIINSERITQRFINAIGESKNRIKTTSIRLVLDREPQRSVTGRVDIPVESKYQQSVKRTLS